MPAPSPSLQGPGNPRSELAPRWAPGSTLSAHRRYRTTGRARPSGLARSVRIRASRIRQENPEARAAGSLSDVRAARPSGLPENSCHSVCSDPHGGAWPAVSGACRSPTSGPQQRLKVFATHVRRSLPLCRGITTTRPPPPPMKLSRRPALPPASSEAAAYQAFVRICIRLQPVQLSNDPSAGSPTETLLRLLLPLNDQVWTSFRPVRASRRHPIAGRKPAPLSKTASPKASLNHSIGSSDGRCVQRAGT